MRFHEMISWYTEAATRGALLKKSVLRNFTKFTGKYLCQGLFFNKDAGLRPATLLKKRLWHRSFPVNFVKFLRTPFLRNTSGRLLLDMVTGKSGNQLTSHKKEIRKWNQFSQFTWTSAKVIPTEKTSAGYNFSYDSRVQERQ